jgi:hypothetical protein
VEIIRRDHLSMEDEIDQYLKDISIYNPDLENLHSGGAESTRGVDTSSRFTCGSLRDIQQEGCCNLLPPTSRVWLAVNDAARGAKIKAPDQPFFVAPKVAARFSLSPHQLWRGLNALERKGWLEKVSSAKGKFRPIRFGPVALDAIRTSQPTRR